jgi:glyoxylase-like metal-dependent hydrolase (beta-lactamase superfamily II)
VEVRGDEAVSRYLRAFAGKWQLIAGVDKLLGALEIVETFGHTPGHIAIGIGSCSAAADVRLEAPEAHPRPGQSPPSGQQRGPVAESDTSCKRIGGIQRGG